MNYRLFFYSLVVFFNSLQLPAQTQHSTDSIKGIIQQQNSYEGKMQALQPYLKKIYSTQLDATIELARLGYDLSLQQNHAANMGDFLRIIGGALGKKGNIDSASFYYYKSLELLTKTDNSEKLGLLYDDMARMYRKLRQPKRALEFYDKALAIYEKTQDLEGIARINNESGVVFRDEGDYKTANERFEKSLLIQQQRNDSVGIGYSLEFLGYNQLLVKAYGQSERYLKQALAIREKLNDKFALMLNYTALGEFYKEIKQHALSNEYFERSNAVARQIQFADIQKYNYEQITENYEALGDYKQAFQNFKAYKVLNDSLYNAQKLKDVEEISTRYETAEKENQILQQQTKITNRNFWIFGLAALVIIIALIGFILYKQQLLKRMKLQRDNEIGIALKKIETQQKLQEQRLAISRDLHDNIGAQLSFIIAAIDTIRYYAKDKDENLVHKLNNIASFSKDTIQELRDTVWAMNKQGITIKDLETRIEKFNEHAAQSHSQTKVQLHIDHAVPMDMAFTGMQGLNIFRIIQEATNNALKYAAAQTVQVTVSKANKEMHFSIEDNGKGFAEQDVEPGNGLVNMRKRAAELGSTLTLKSAAGNGTLVAFNVALTDQ